MDDRGPEAATNTLKAGWLELKLAKLFGKKSTHQDSVGTMTLRNWRGKYYLVDFKERNGATDE